MLRFLVLPYGLGPVEQGFTPASDLREAGTTIDIEADPASVWHEVVQVPPIQAHEHGFAWSHMIGFPRPIAATASGTGVGALREATFERGVLFVERVTTYVEQEGLRFSIHADADTIPARALDQHVTVGGPYFDVLEGSYMIERLGPQRVRLHLSSEHRPSTGFNGYASPWTDFIMRDTQECILEIVARRAERRALGQPLR